MSTNNFAVLALPLVALLAACSQGPPTSSSENDTPNNDTSNAPPQGTEEISQPLTMEEQRVYLGAIAPWLIGRVLNQTELEALSAADDVSTVIESWRDEPGLADAARRFIDNLLFTGGSAGDIDFNLPGNLAHTVTRNHLPWREILTSSQCYDAAGKAIECDTGAPYAAGLLTTRAYLASRAGRFNLTRASAMLGAFICRSYPLPVLEEPHIEKSRLLVLFRAETAEEQEDARAQAGFGNGSECYNCHGQFSLHAQPFVRFDEAGLWHENATGLQDESPEAELGRSVGGLMTSHLEAPEEARSEQSQMLGQPVDNLTGVAQVVAESELFIPCQSRHLLEAVFSVDSEQPVSPSLIDKITATASERNVEPTFHDLVVSTFAERRVIDIFLKSLPSTDMEVSP